MKLHSEQEPCQYYELTLDSLPGKLQGDEYGDLLVYSPKSGWCLGHYTELRSLIEEGYKYWTYLPLNPGPVMTQEEIDVAILNALMNLSEQNQMLHDYWYTTMYSEPPEGTRDWIKVPKAWTQRNLAHMEHDVQQQICYLKDQN